MGYRVAEDLHKQVYSLQRRTKWSAGNCSCQEEDQLNGIRVHWDDQIMKFKVNQKRALDLIIRQRRVEIEKIAAERTKCPAIVANEAEICRQKVNVEMEHVHANEDAEIELAREHHEQQRVKIVM